MSKLGLCCKVLLVALGCISLATSVSSALLLEISAPKAQYLLDEPFFVRVTLKNLGDADAYMLRKLDPGHGILCFEVCAPKSDWRAYNPRGQATKSLEDLARAVIRLRPGETYSGMITLTFEYDRNAHKPVTLLRHPGEYCLRAIYETFDGLPIEPMRLGSNELRITVAEPAGIDASAHKLLSAGPWSEELGIWNAQREQAETYEQLLRDFAASRYSIYARNSLGQVYHVMNALSPHSAEGKAALGRAVQLFSAVAETAGDTPLGLHVRRSSATALAQSGDVSRAQRLVESVFVSPAATDEDRLEALGWLALLEEGYWQSGGSKGHSAKPSPSTVPLVSFARSLGFSVIWDRETKTAAVSAPRVTCAITAGENKMTVNGVERTGARASVRDGRMEVSPAAIAVLMAEQRGQGMANALAGLLAQAPPNKAK